MNACFRKQQVEGLLEERFGVDHRDVLVPFVLSLLMLLLYALHEEGKTSLYNFTHMLDIYLKIEALQHAEFLAIVHRLYL